MAMVDGRRGGIWEDLDWVDVGWMVDGGGGGGNRGRIGGKREAQ